MTDKIYETFRRRLAEKTQDCSKWTPRDALVAAIEMIDKGAQVDQLVVHMLVQDEGGRCHEGFIANMTFEQHIALLELAKTHAIEDWWVS